MSQTYAFDEVARLPLPGDNVAIATQRLEAGTGINHGAASFYLSHTVMEGHRFAVAPIAPGDELLSWELPFGRATALIAPGAYACNQGMLDALGGRAIDFDLPAEPNFADHIEPYRFDEGSFTPIDQVTGTDEARTFSGYLRARGRGVGTRNYIVVLGTSSRTTGFARELAARFADADTPGVDGVVAIAHTEGGGWEKPNNEEHLLRTLAGFVVHPNVAAVLAVDYGSEAVNNQILQDYMARNDYPLGSVPHLFMSIDGGFAGRLLEGERQIRRWLAEVGVERSAQPLEHLRLALQCGGSDAFSGISGNPLASWAAREIIRGGGGANLAETDELIGAEPYVLQNVRDAETAHRFLAMVERFKERVAWHGESCEGNPSGGNKFRGLYNIVLKSIGAAMKRHPDVRLDYCIEYGERMRAGGYYFMDSPGNDLESIAGQVASGCNAIYFVTGNGSITNFPFVPTIKIVTTTPRFELLAADMDVNAGAYQDGTPMDELGAELFDLTLNVAGGQRSKGEQAGHAQVQIWRNWPQQDGSRLEELRAAPVPTGERLQVEGEEAPAVEFAGLRGGRGLVSDQVGLVLPTSLCSGQIAQMIAARLNAEGFGREKGISRFVALVHTEGCGVAGAEAEALYARSMLSYLTHPLVRCAVLLEHGCEKTHNDYMRNELAERGLQADDFGWASVQLDGGIDKAGEKVVDWFEHRLAAIEPALPESAGLQALRVGLLAAGPLSNDAAAVLARLTRWLVGAGATVVVPEGGALLGSATYKDAVFAGQTPAATLAHGQAVSAPGCYVLETPTEHWTEIVTGLGATGVEMILAHTGDHPVQGHPLVPVLQVSAESAVQVRYAEDLDFALVGPADAWANELLDLLVEVASRRYQPVAVAQHNTDFQFTRGLLGVSM